MTERNMFFDASKKVARTKFGNLYSKNPNFSRVFDDETYFPLSHSKINGNETSDISATSASIKFTLIKKVQSKLLVYVCISERGISAPVFRKSGLTVNQIVYLDCNNVY